MTTKTKAKRITKPKVRTEFMETIFRDADNDIVEAAKEWWRSIRLYGMTEKQHLKHPTSGALSKSEELLAHMVASRIRLENIENSKL